MIRARSRLDLPFDLLFPGCSRRFCNDAALKAAFVSGEGASWQRGEFVDDVVERLLEGFDWGDSIDQSGRRAPFGHRCAHKKVQTSKARLNPSRGLEQWIDKSNSRHQADPVWSGDEGGCFACGRKSQPSVKRQQPGAGGDAIDGCDDRFWQFASFRTSGA